jgi:hypothetical protein
MNIEIALLIWYAIGVAGKWFLWVDCALFQARLYAREPEMCPSPSTILMCAVGGLFGVIMVLVFFAVALSKDGMWGHSKAMRRIGAWWHTPICEWWK